MVKKEWIDKGFVDEPIAKELDLKSEIRELCRKKNAVIMAHYYTEGIIQDLADFVGDSLALAQKAAKTEADIIVMCGVHFMGETNKILCPDKKVLVPDLNATCSLAESCPADEFSRFVSAHPGHTVISYVNTTAATKAVTDVVVTSSNARQIVESFPSDEKIIFGPDRNLGNYINSVTGRDMLLWDGACHVHEKFSVEKILELKKSHPEAKVLAHPECKGAVLKLADVVGSTAALLKYAIRHEGKEFIVATESGILHEMQKACPEKTFIPAPPDDSTCACNECNYMRLITLEKLYNTLKYEWPEIVVDAEVAEKAVKPIHRMLEISEVRIVMKRLKTFTDERGSLTVAETGKDLPFEVKRAYWIYGVPEGHERGKHANRITYQYLVAVRGCVTITLEDKDGRRTYVLDAPDKGLLIPPLTWNELLHFSEDAVLLVLSSQPYRPEMYINSYEEFLRMIHE
mgnify:CR=1 FL=1